MRLSHFILLIVVIASAANAASFPTVLSRAAGVTLSATSTMPVNFLFQDSTFNFIGALAATDLETTVFFCIDAAAMQVVRNQTFDYVIDSIHFDKASQMLYVAGGVGIQTRLVKYALYNNCTLQEVISSSPSILRAAALIPVSSSEFWFIPTYANFIFKINPTTLATAGAPRAVPAPTADTTLFGALSSAHATDSHVFFTTNTPKALYRVEIANWNNIILQNYDAILPAGTIETSAADEGSGMGYIGTNNPTMILRYNMSDLLPLSNISLSVRGINSLQVDATAGMLYATSEEDSRVFVIQCLLEHGGKSFARVNTLRLNAGEDRGRTAIMDAANWQIYVGTSSSDVVKVQYPVACTEMCSGRGNCSYGQCSCESDRRGAYCQLLPCLPDETCSSGGVCDNGTCICFPGRNGTSCEIETCPMDCYGRGTCNLQTHNCTCFDSDSWQGADCGTQVIQSVRPCPELSANCSKCFANPKCVWCATTSTCEYADSDTPADGPRYGWCDAFYYDQCPEAGADMGSNAGAAITYALIAILMLVNIVSAIRDDWDAESRQGAEATRASYWRSLRSSFGWAAVDRLQFVALTGLMRLSLPSMFLHYSQKFWWLLGIVTLPVISFRPPSTEELLNANQLTRSAGALPNQLIFHCFIFFSIVLGGLLVLCAIAFAIGSFTKQSFKWRVSYMLLRFGTIVMVALGATAGWTLSMRSQLQGVDWVAFGLAILVIIVGVAAVPLIFMKVFGFPIVFLKPVANKKRLFMVDFRKRFGLMYETYNIRGVWWGSINLLKRFLLAVLVAGIPSGIGSIIAALAIEIIYLIGVLIASPFLDPISQTAEIIFTVLDVAFWAVMFAYPAGVTSPLIIGIVQIAIICLFMVVCAGLYIFATMRQANVWSFSALLPSSSSSSAAASSNNKKGASKK